MPNENTNRFLADNKVDKSYIDASIVSLTGTATRVTTLAYGDDAEGNVGDVVLIDASVYYKDAATHWVSWVTTSGF